MKESDETLIARALGGDEAAFRALYDRHVDEVRGYLRRHLTAALRTRISVADLLQEAYATAFRRLPEYEGPREGSFRHWLLQIADFKLKEATRFHLRTAKRAVSRELTGEGRPPTNAWRGHEPTPSAGAIAAETGAALDRAMAELPENYRTILVLVHAQGYAIADAALQLGRTVEATRKLYGRAVSRLARGMEEA